MPDTKRTATGVLGGLAGLVGLSAVAGLLVTATVTPAIAVSGAAASSAISVFENLPEVLEIDELMLPTTVYYREPSGEDVELTKFWDQNRNPVAWEEVSSVMYDAILASEDPRYYEHGGVDLIGTTRALVSNLEGNGQVQGGSSISQQYVKNVLIQRCAADADNFDEEQVCFFEATQSAGTEGIERKLQEMRYAIALEQKYSKNEILLGYLNIANFGGTTYGIGAAALFYYGVPASDLSLTQAATLAGVVQNPNTYRIDQPDSEVNGEADGQVVTTVDGQLAALDTLLADGTITQEQHTAAADGYTATKGRQLYVLSRMMDEGKITRDQYIQAVLEPITPNINEPRTGCGVAGGAAYFCQYVRSVIETDEAFGATLEERQDVLKRGGLNIYTTLDPRVQRTSEEAMREWAPTKRDDLSFGSAAVSIEANTGRILSMVQNTIFTEDRALADSDPAYSSQVYAADEDHGSSIGFPVGSTYKLFTLIDWLEKGHSLNESLNGRNRIFPRMDAACDGGWTNQTNARIENFANSGGYTGTVASFTAQSLNSGYLAMAERLDLCDINRVADRMGVRTGNGELTYESNPETNYIANVAFDVLGSKNIAPLSMASAYATVANNGVYCTPKVIDRVTDANGQDVEPPMSTCSQVISPEVAATAAFALQGVMTGNGTGVQSNPRDGIPVIGKTGTHNLEQTWMVESSTRATTAVWVGNSTGFESLYRKYHNGVEIAQLRHRITPAIQREINSLYGGDPFPQPDRSLVRPMLTDLPNVVGLPIADAEQRLRAAGFDSIVGAPVDAPDAEGVVAAQTPEAGRVAAGTTITISPSNGQGVAVPELTGRTVGEARGQLAAAGFGDVTEQCEESDDAPPDERVTSTVPAAGTLVNRNARITVVFASDDC